MTIHLFKSNDVDNQLFSRIFDLLESVPGPITFKHHERFSMELDDLELKKKVVHTKKQFEKAHDNIMYSMEENSAKLIYRKIQFPRT